jgi:hypothetical protein
MVWNIDRIWPWAVGYVCVIAIVIAFRLISNRKKRKQRTGKKAPLEGEKKVFTFQEFLLSLAIFGLILNFYSLELNRINTEKNLENYEVTNRPYIFIRKINGKLDKTTNVLKCRVAVTNAGSVPSLNTKIDGKVTYGDECRESEDKPFYSAIYPESVVWTRFGFPFKPVQPVKIVYEVTYSDYRGYLYEYEVHIRYNWEFNSFTFEKSDENVIKPLIPN